MGKNFKFGKLLLLIFSMLLVFILGCEALKDKISETNSDETTGIPEEINKLAPKILGVMGNGPAEDIFWSKLIIEGSNFSGASTKVYLEDKTDRSIGPKELRLGLINNSRIIAYLPSDISAEHIYKLIVESDNEKTSVDVKLLKGDRGEIGPVGPVGPQGPAGIKGETGAKGDKGDQGEQGIGGPAGLKGEQGPKGEKGDQGLKGDKGDQGLQGIQGEAGASGQNGEQGFQGIQGIKGEKGDKGDTGLQGIQGGKGDKGDALNPWAQFGLYSGHFDTEALAFNDWNDAEDNMVPSTCAKCHSASGYIDFLGADGSTYRKVEVNQPIGQTLNCFTCHNSAASLANSVNFPSNVELNSLSHTEAICMDCHQGRQSYDTITAYLATKNGTDTSVQDVTNTAISFQNMHYLGAGSTLYASETRGGWQYAGKEYDIRLQHEGINKCDDCHDVHTLKVNINTCRSCHSDFTISSTADLEKIRMAGSAEDYDGDGNLEEGIYEEIAGLQDVLMDAMQSYAVAKSSPAEICYDPMAYPYFFLDTNKNTICDTTEVLSANKYNKWTPRLLKAAHNYQVTIKDPGAFAHNPKYIIELLYDSIEDLELTELVAVTNFDKLHREDGPHFSGGKTQWREWDKPNAPIDSDKNGVISGTEIAVADPDGDGYYDGNEFSVSTSCSRCHSSSGFLYSINHEGTDPISADSNGVLQVYPAGNGLLCKTCHTGTGYVSGNAPRRVVNKVSFPGGVKILDQTTLAENDKDESFLCITCHRGRNSKATVDIALESVTSTHLATASSLSLPSPHYLPAGAVQYGSQVQVGYEFDANSQGTPLTYFGKFSHIGEPEDYSCTFCHRVSANEHNFKVDLGDTINCTYCHKNNNYRKGNEAATDFDGDGNNTESLADEMATFKTRLVQAIEDYYNNNNGSGTDINFIFTTNFYNDLNNNGVVDNDESRISDTVWDFDHDSGHKLIKAAYNMRFIANDPGAWAHNRNYAFQLLYDSIEIIGGNVTGLTRP